MRQMRLKRSKSSLSLKGKYGHNLAQLEGWGLPTRLGARCVTMRKPSTPNEHIAFLRAYVAKESTLVEGQQITDPPLSTVQNLLDEIEDALDTRTLGRDQRELGIEQRGGIRGDLLHWLQIGALMLVMQNGGTISTALQLHGYTVVERLPNGGNGTETPAPETPGGEVKA